MSAFSLHSSTAGVEAWRRTRCLIDCLFILTRLADGNPEPVKQLSDHLNCVFSITKIALERVSHELFNNAFKFKNQFEFARMKTRILDAAVGDVIPSATIL